MYLYNNANCIFVYVHLWTFAGMLIVYKLYTNVYNCRQHLLFMFDN